jgi:sporulation protein YlmC with PRC-barrel domain
MSIKTIILASGAVLALVVVPLAATEAATTASTQNESAKTRDLNLQQLKTPGTANVAANTTSNATTSSSAKPATNSKPPASRGTSASAANKNDTAAVDKDSITADEMKKAVTLTKVEMPKETLAAAKIDSRLGEHIGQVQDVVLDAKGNPSALHVDVGEFLGGGPHVVSINSSRLSYLPDRKLLVANMTKAQIRALPTLKDSAAH